MARKKVRKTKGKQNGMIDLELSIAESYTARACTGKRKTQAKIIGSHGFFFFLGAIFYFEARKGRSK